MRTLGISCWYHDSAACLVEDGSVRGGGTISTAANYDTLDRHFTRQPEARHSSRQT